MSALWQIRDVYHKIEAISPEKIVCRDNFMAYFDNDVSNTSAILNIYEINTNLSHVKKKRALHISCKNLISLDINHDGKTVFVLDNSCAFMDIDEPLPNYLQLLQQDVNAKFVIGTKKAFLKANSRICYFSINDSIANMKLLSMTNDFILDEFTSLAIYDLNLVIGSPTSNSNKGLIHVYNDSLEKIFEFSHTQPCAIGYQVSIHKDSIICRGFYSIADFSTNDEKYQKNIPIVVFEKSNNNTYIEKANSRTSVDNLLEICGNSNFFFTLTYGSTNSENRTINIQDHDLEKNEIFFDGDPSKNVFLSNPATYIHAQKTIAANDTFLYVKNGNIIYVFVYGHILKYPSITNNIFPVEGNYELYDKTGGTTKPLTANEYVRYLFDGSFSTIKPHKCYIGFDYYNAEYDNLTLLCGEESFTYSKRDFVNHDFGDFKSSGVNEIYFGELGLCDSFSLAFDSDVVLDEWEFVRFSTSPDFFVTNNLEGAATTPYFNITSQMQLLPGGVYTNHDATADNVTDTVTDTVTDSVLDSDNNQNQEIVIPALIFNVTPEEEEEPICNNLTNPGTTLHIVDDGTLFITQREFSRIYGNNPIYCNFTLEQLNSRKNFEAAKGQNRFNNGISRRSVIQHMSKMTKRQMKATLPTNTFRNVKQQVESVFNSVPHVDNTKKKYFPSEGKARDRGVTRFNSGALRGFRPAPITGQRTIVTKRTRTLTKPSNKSKPFSFSITPTYTKSQLVRTFTLPNKKSLLVDVSNVIVLAEDEQNTIDHDAISSDVFAIFNVYVTYINNEFKVIINNFGNRFLYCNNIYRFDVSHYTNYGHLLRFSSDPQMTKLYSQNIYSVPGTSGAYVEICPRELGSIYISTELHGLAVGSFYNPISLMTYDLPSEYTTIVVNVEFIKNGNKFVFINDVSDCLFSRQYYKFDVSNPTNNGFYLKFSKDNTSKKAYNTISIGTPGTDNACVYFYSDVSMSMYMYDQATGYDCGSLYNPINIHEGDNSVGILELNKREIYEDLYYGYEENISVSCNKIAVPTRQSTLLIYDICSNNNPIVLSESSILEEEYKNTIIKYAEKVFVKEFIEHDALLVTNKHSGDKKSIVLYETSPADNNIWSIKNQYIITSDTFGDAITSFCKEFIVSDYKNDTIYRFDASLNYIARIQTATKNCDFGKALSCNDSYLVVGAPKTNNYCGQIYIYNRDFVISQVLDVENSIAMGVSIYLSPNNDLLVGANNCVYFYEFIDNEKLFVRRHTFINPGKNIYEKYGESLYIDDHTNIFIGSSNYEATGAVYVYCKKYCSWILEKTMIEGDKNDKLGFGHKIFDCQDGIIINSKGGNKFYRYGGSGSFVASPNANIQTEDNTSKNKIKRPPEIIDFYNQGLVGKSLSRDCCAHYAFNVSKGDVIKQLYLSHLSDDKSASHFIVLLQKDETNVELLDTSYFGYTNNKETLMHYTHGLNNDGKPIDILNKDLGEGNYNILMYRTNTINDHNIEDDNNIYYTLKAEISPYTPLIEEVASETVQPEIISQVIEQSQYVGYKNIKRPPAIIETNNDMRNMIFNNISYDYYDHVTFATTKTVDKVYLSKFIVNTFGNLDANLIICIQGDKSNLSISDPTFFGYSFEYGDIIQKRLPIYSIANYSSYEPVKINDLPLKPGVYNILIYLENANDYSDISYKLDYEVGVDEGDFNNLMTQPTIFNTTIKPDNEQSKNKTLLGSIVFEPTSALIRESDSNLMISIWSDAFENIAVPPNIDVTVKKTITVFYDLLNARVLEFVDESYGLSLMQIINAYRDGEFDLLNPIFSKTDVAPFSAMLNKLKISANNATQKIPQMDFIEETRGIYISLQEFKIFSNYIDSLHKSLDLIGEGLQMFNDFTALKETIKEYKIAYETLYDLTKLEEHVKLHNKKTPLEALNVNPGLKLAPKLKPHIEKYVSLYGWPENYVFNSELMAKIFAQENVI
tara:strand:- start:1786 stop:7623 length:5838 start_codon:yes stop_codon:yes gene_type:complete